MTVFQEWTCADGSGSFSLEHHNRFDSASFDFTGRQDVGTWTITQGQGSYENLTGSGDVTLDGDEQAVIYSGEVQQS